MHPLFAISHNGLTNCDLIDGVWCSTDDDTIKSPSNFYDFNIIDRSLNVSGDDDSHLDVIRHGVHT